MSKTKKLFSMFMVIIIVFCSLFLSQIYVPQEASAAAVVSRVVTTAEGKGYLEVDGKPYYYSCVENWGKQQTLGDKTNPYTTSPYYSTYKFETPMSESWLENVFEKTKAANFNTMQIFLKWNEIEPATKGSYDWHLIDKYIDWANQYGLRLDLVWTGSNHCGGARLAGNPNGWMTWIPEYLQDRDKYFGANPGGEKDIFHVFIPDGGIHSADAEYLFQSEREAVAALFNHLSVYDTNHRVIVFQVLNEPNMSKTWNTNKSVHLDLLNRLGGVVKSSNYVVATRVNLSGPSLDPDIKNLPNIDMVGTDPYQNTIRAIKSIVTDTAGSKMPHIGENDGTYTNTSSLVVAAIANGGFYNCFQLNDHYPDQGIYNPDETYKNWVLGTIPSMRHSGNDMKNLNASVNKIGSIIAKASKSKMAGFNLDWDTPNPDWDWWQPVGSYRVGMKSSAYGDVGLAVSDGNNIYLLSDTPGAVTFRTELQPASASSGYLDSNGSWVSTGSKTVTQNGWYCVTVNSGECVKLTMPAVNIPIGSTIWLKANANGNYISTWLNDINAPLQARVNQVLDWEKFIVVDAGGGYIGLKSYANNKYIGAWLSDENNPLQARVDTLEDWQKFRWIDLGNGNIALQSYANSNYVSAWASDSNTPLQARVTDIQSWQIFQWGIAD